MKNVSSYVSFEKQIIEIINFKELLMILIMVAHNQNGSHLWDRWNAQHYFFKQ